MIGMLPFLDYGPTWKVGLWNEWNVALPGLQRYLPGMLRCLECGCTLYILFWLPPGDFIQPEGGTRGSYLESGVVFAPYLECRDIE